MRFSLFTRWRSRALWIFLLAGLPGAGISAAEKLDLQPAPGPDFSASDPGAFNAPASSATVSASTAPAAFPAPPPVRSARPEAPALSGSIVAIEVRGNANVRDRVILSEVKTRKGDAYKPEQLSQDVQSVYALGNFEDVTVSAEKRGKGVAVIFNVVEKPSIKRIYVKINGSKKVSKGKILDAILLKDGDPFDSFKLDLDTEKIIALYKDNGFAAAEIEHFTTELPNHRLNLTFYITPGKRVLIETVNWIGVKAFPVKKIRKQVKTRRKKVFKQETFDNDLKAVQKYYKDRGYPLIQIGEVSQTFNEDKTRMTVTIPVEEGPLMKFGDTSFDGNSIFDSNRLRQEIQFKTGETFNQEKVDETLAKLQDVYGAQGYIRVQIRPDYAQDIEHGRTSIAFNILEGDIVYVDHIGVEGNAHTKEYVIRREILLKEGEPFSSVKTRKSVERLYNLGFLDNVDVDVQQPVAPERADVIFTVAEGKPGVLSAGAGFSSLDGLVGTAQVQHINFLGRGQRVNAQWEFGGRRNSFDVGWTEPWFLGKPLTLGLNVFNVRRQLQFGVNRDAYKTRDRGGSITLGPRFSEIYNLLFTYTYANRRTFDVADDPAIREAVLGPEALTDPTITEARRLNSNVAVQLIRDSRDNRFDPTRGTRASLTHEVGGIFPGEAINFNKPILDISRHFPTFWKFVLSIHGEFGVVKPYGKSTRVDIVDELFRVGGSESVRGYDLGRVGVDDPGGQVMNVYNIEYKFPIAPDERGRTLLQGVFFYDIGGSWDRIRDVRYEVSDAQTGLKQGVGFGIRFKTPVFPLRLDWGYGLNTAPGEDPSQFYFTVGSLF